MNLNDHYRALGYGWDQLAAADDGNRVALLFDQADRFADLAASRLADPHADEQIAVLLRVIADADLAATGRLSRRHYTDSVFEAEVGGFFDRFAAEPDLTARACMLEELCGLLRDASVAETIAYLPYAPGMVGWRHEEHLPSARTLRGFLAALGVAWRTRRAV
ncbi:hypothetical protein [Actinoplanes sp. URMC 104]|uniref:hypothetical protein n=1 Tax=Actinoplanes sp. URMC 104 TaxID=3423409 RepID=UPI003F1BDF97